MRTRRVVACLAVASGVLWPIGGADAGGGACHQGPAPTAVQRTVVDMTKNCMEPEVVRVDLGETVEVVNRDTVLHNLYGRGWFAGELAPGESMHRTFTEPGTYTFACLLHAGMTGAVLVGQETTPTALAAIPSSPPAQSQADTNWNPAIGVALAAAVLGCIAVGWLLGRSTGRLTASH